MTSSDPVLAHEIPVIRQIIRDETWLEGERRGCHVPANDGVVKENVCRVILRVGQQLRDSIETQLASQTSGGSAVGAVTCDLSTGSGQA